MSKILIYSPDESIREAIKSVLSDNFELILCADAEQGIDILANHKNNDRLSPIKTFLLNPDSEEDAGELIKKAQETSPEIKIIIIGDYKSEEKLLKVLKKGANGYITTPLKTGELLTLCKSK